MALILDDAIEQITREIWRVCQEDLQAIDNEIMDNYQQLTDVRNRQLQRQRMTDRGRRLNVFYSNKILACKT